MRVSRENVKLFRDAKFHCKQSRCVDVHNDCTNPLSRAATFMKTYQPRVNTGVSDMETCHLRSTQSMLSNDMLLVLNAAAQLPLMWLLMLKRPSFDLRAELAQRGLRWWSSNSRLLKYYLTPHRHCEQHHQCCWSQFPPLSCFISPLYLLTTLNTLFHSVLPIFSEAPEGRTMHTCPGRRGEEGELGLLNKKIRGPLCFRTVHSLH